MKQIAILAVVALLAIVGVGVVLEERGALGTPSQEPAVLVAVEEALGMRFESVIEKALPWIRVPGASDGPAAISPDAPTEIGDPLVIRDRPTSFNGDLRDVPTSREPITSPEQEPRPETKGTPKAPAGDPVLQSTAPRASAPVATVTDGLSLAPGGGWPPDPVIDVGPNHVIEAVNKSWAVYDRTTRAQLATGTFNALITGTGTPCDNANQGDPVVLYDSIADRWILSDFAFTSINAGPFYQCFAVSKTADPVSGGWWFYAFETGQPPSGATGNHLPDYPKLGVWPDAIYMTVNLFAWNAVAGEHQASNARVFAFNRTAMEAGETSSAIAIDLAFPSFNVLPAHARVVTGLPASGTPGYMVETWPGDKLRVWKFAVDWTTPGNSAVTGSDVNVAAYTAPAAYATTPGLAIETLDDVPMMQFQYANILGAESLWLTHTVAAGSQTGLRWYQLNATGGTIASTPVQQSTWAPGDGLFRFLPSLAVNKLGDMAIGYAVSGPALNPGIRYAGRLAADPAGAITLDEQVLQAGGGTQTTYQRWGDYSAMALDPADGCTFWYVNEYFAETGTDWRTAIGSFRYPDCTSSSAPVPTPTPEPTVTPEPAPAPTVRAIRATSATRAQLAKGLRVALTPSAPATVTIVVRARGKVVGRVTRKVTAKAQTLTVPISKQWLKTAKRGTALAITVTGKTTAGATLTPAKATARVR